MALIKCENVSIGYEGQMVVHDQNFEIYQGDYLCIVGENGSGKSTLSSIISGVYPQSEGELTLDGKPYKPADTLDAQNHGISMIAQEMGTLPGIKVADNLLIGKEQLFTKHGVVD